MYIFKIITLQQVSIPISYTTSRDFPILNIFGHLHIVGVTKI